MLLAAINIVGTGSILLLETQLVDTATVGKL